MNRSKSTLPLKHKTSSILLAMYVAVQTDFLMPVVCANVCTRYLDF